MAYRGRRTAVQTTPQSPQKDTKYDIMIKEALSNLHERRGSTRHNIARFITFNYKNEDKDEVLKDLSIALKRGVEDNSLTLMSGFGASARYSLGDKIDVSHLKQADTKEPTPPARKRACKKERLTEHSHINTSSYNGNKKGHREMKESKGDVGKRKAAPKNSTEVKGRGRKRGVKPSTKSRSPTQELADVKGNDDSTKSEAEPSPIKSLSASSSVVIPGASNDNSSIPEAIVPSRGVSDGMILMLEHTFDLDRLQVHFINANFYVGWGSWITGVAISEHGKIIMADRENYEVKLFSAEFNILSSLPLDDQPWGISICRRDDVAITSSSHNVYIVSFLDDKLEIRQIVKLEYFSSGITTSMGHIFLTAEKSLKKIDMSGHVYWSTSTDKMELFRNTHNVTSFIIFDGDKYHSRIVVTDFYSRNVILVDSETGEVLKVSQSKLKGINGVTRDRFNNIYICSAESKAVSVMSCDLSEERVILTTKSNKHLHPDALSDELYDRPQSIAYDITSNQLMVSNHSAKGSEVCHMFRLEYDTTNMSHLLEWEMYTLGMNSAKL